MKPDMNPWLYFAFAALAAGTFIGLIMVIPDDEPAMRTALLGLVVLAGQAAIARWIGEVRRGQADIAEKVNGRMSQLIEQADRRETETNVSRETSPVVRPRRRKRR